MKKVLSLVLAVMLLVAAVPFAMAEGEVTLNVWSFTNEFQGMIEKYFAPSHPDIKFNFTLYPTDGGEYTSHVDTLLAADATAEDAPDIFTLEAAFVKKYVNSDWTADLKDLGFTDEDFATCIPAMLQIGANPDGVQKGLAWQSTPGALMYRADLAEKYLGVTTPEEFQEKVADWDAFLETAEELKEASEGACKMFCATGDIWNAYQYNREAGWVVDGKLNIDDNLYDYLDLLKTAEENGYQAKLSRLLTNNGADYLDDTNGVLESVEQSILRKVRKVLNCFVVYETDSAEDVQKMQTLLKETRDSNEAQLNNVKDFLLAITDFLNKQGDDNTGAEKLDIYKRTILESISDAE